ncbi:MAG: hypothetical protein COY80_04245 [Candidatus Pacebacteria bacterium CG_4_10_14_0_8_um_filter_42_14]|nr:MAG: hypothetical protein COY80_04245 [Candidatus Pacebacteria bacterium CG_4_10_14_0_8_um_filter_42_14]
MPQQKLIITHHAPDLDAISSVWLLKRFDSQNYANAKIGYVNPGLSLDPNMADNYGILPHNVVHVDTGRGEFDHHTSEKNSRDICAATLVRDYLIKSHPELANDSALKAIVDHVTEIDHFGEIFWPEPDSYRYNFMLHELIRGSEFMAQNTDDSQMQFGMQALDNVYAVMKQSHKASQILDNDGLIFQISAGKCLAISTKNDDVIKLAQKRGMMLVVRKDPSLGHIRIKVRPDSSLTLEKLYERVLKLDQKGTWYYHPGGKMLINGSRKHLDQQPSPLSLQEIVTAIKDLYE